MACYEKRCIGSLNLKLGAVHKKRSQSEGDCLVRTFFGQERGSDADCALFGVKNFGFFEIRVWCEILVYGVSAQTGGGRAEILRTSRVNFLRFWSFVDGLLLQNV